MAQLNPSKDYSRLPSVEDTDDYIKRWYLHRYSACPHVCIHLITTNGGQPNMAELKFTKDGCKIRRFHGHHD